MPGTLVTHMASSDTTQLLMDEGQQLVECRVLPPPPGKEQRGGLVSTTRNGPILHLAAKAAGLPLLA